MIFSDDLDRLSWFPFTYDYDERTMRYTIAMVTHTAQDGFASVNEIIDQESLEMSLNYRDLVRDKIDSMNLDMIDLLIDNAVSGDLLGSYRCLDVGYHGRCELWDGHEGSHKNGSWTWSLLLKP